MPGVLRGGIFCSADVAARLSPPSDMVGGLIRAIQEERGPEPAAARSERILARAWDRFAVAGYSCLRRVGHGDLARREPRRHLRPASLSDRPGAGGGTRSARHACGRRYRSARAHGDRLGVSREAASAAADLDAGNASEGGAAYTPWRARIVRWSARARDWQTRAAIWTRSPLPSETQSLWLPHESSINGAGRGKL